MKIFSLLFLLCVFNFCYAQKLEGKWETYDDKTGEKRSVVEIYKKDAKYFGKIVSKKEGQDTDVCKNCEGSKKNQPIIGMEIIENLEKEDNTYEGGTITDPESGNEYKCILELDGANKLKVRGYIGFSLLGRTQYWKRQL